MQVLRCWVLLLLVSCFLSQCGESKGNLSSDMQSRLDGNNGTSYSTYQIITFFFFFFFFFFWLFWLWGCLSYSSLLLAPRISDPDQEASVWIGFANVTDCNTKVGSWCFTIACTGNYLPVPFPVVFWRQPNLKCSMHAQLWTIHM